MDMACLVTGLLHDVVEDTPITLDELRNQFGDEVARCVDGVTKLSKLNMYSREQTPGSFLILYRPLALATNASLQSPPDRQRQRERQIVLLLLRSPATLQPDRR